MIPPTSEGDEPIAPADDEPTPTGTEPTKRRRSSRVVTEWLLVVALAIGGAIFIRAFIVQTFSVPSSSMYPTLQIGDRILVDRIPGLAHSIHRGDIIVFHKVAADTDGGGPEDLVKRVIGLPGDTVSSRGDTILINGKPLAEPWLHLGAVSSQGVCGQAAFDVTSPYFRGAASIKVPANHYFVMGDCRGISDDSRYWGTVPTSNIIGRVFTVIWRSNHPWIHWL